MDQDSPSNGRLGWTSPQDFSDSDECERPAKRARIEAGCEDEDPPLPGSPLPSPPSSPVDRKKCPTDAAEPPKNPPRLPGGRVADVVPWNGRDVQYALDETLVKSGCCNKASSSNRVEAGSARQALWPNLAAKNGLGLQVLSSFFVQVLDTRQTMRQVTKPPTFKLPPRLTVTDSKREAWLRDLADPAKPLRRQSRTIPHGIRGRVMLDHCLNKCIPLTRAVWMIRCVGANEQRAFRRKGVASSVAATSERKWLIEWTTQVEQFLGSSIGACNQSEWRQRMTYVISLVGRLYSESLLDQPHFLDWTINSFATAALESLPIWLTLARAYWKEIVVSIKSGRRLARGIISHLLSLSARDALRPLKSRLLQLVALLAASYPACLVVPDMWPRFEYLVVESGAPESAVREIIRRNEQLTNRIAYNACCPALKLYAELDSIGLSVDYVLLATHCQELMPQHLIPALLDWVSSTYRHGLARIYIAARLIQQLQNCGEDTDGAILDYLRRPQKAVGFQAEPLYLIIIELIRQSAFCPSRYLHWLLATADLCPENTSKPAVGLLLVLPPTLIPSHVASLRQMLLRRLGAADLTSHLKEKLEQVEQAIPSGCLASLDSSADKVAISEYIRQRDNKVDLATFCSLRGVLESASDISGLALIIEQAVPIADAALLATITDTVLLHSEVLAVVERLPHIAIFERYKTLRTQHPPDRVLLSALSRLSAQLALDEDVNQQLARDRIACDQGSLAAFSPASDNMTLVHGNVDEADIEIILASGNSMDNKLLQRVFDLVMNRKDAPEKLTMWLNQLRVIGGTNFQLIVQKFTASALREHKARSLVPLIAAECLSLGSVLTLAQTKAGALEVISLVFSPDAGRLSRPDVYRFRVMQRFCTQHHAVELCRLIPLACELDPGLLEVPSILALFSSQCLHRPGAVSSIAASAPPSPGFICLCEALLPSLEDLHPLSLPILGALLAPYAQAKNISLLPLIQSCITGDNPIWPQLLAAARLSPSAEAELHEWARGKLLDGEGKEKFLQVLEITFNNGVPRLPENILLLWEKLSATPPGDLQSLDTLLSMASLYLIPRPSGEATHGSEAAQEGQASLEMASSLLATFSSLLEIPQVKLKRHLYERIYDLAGVVEDAVCASGPGTETGGTGASGPITATFTGAVSGAGGAATPNSHDASHLILYTPNLQTKEPYHPRTWDLIPHAAPTMAENDSAISLIWLDARYVGGFSGG